MVTVLGGIPPTPTAFFLFTDLGSAFLLLTLIIPIVKVHAQLTSGLDHKPNSPHSHKAADKLSHPLNGTQTGPHLSSRLAVCVCVYVCVYGRAGGGGGFSSFITV